MNLSFVTAYYSSKMSRRYIIPFRYFSPAKVRAEEKLASTERGDHPKLNTRRAQGRERWKFMTRSIFNFQHFELLTFLCSVHQN